MNQKYVPPFQDIDPVKQLYSQVNAVQLKAYASEFAALFTPNYQWVEKENKFFYDEDQNRFESYVVGRMIGADIAAQDSLPNEHKAPKVDWLGSPIPEVSMATPEQVARLNASLEVLKDRMKGLFTIVNEITSKNPEAVKAVMSKL